MLLMKSVVVILIQCLQNGVDEHFYRYHLSRCCDYDRHHSYTLICFWHCVGQLMILSKVLKALFLPPFSEASDKLGE